jgi:hypothetical protein
MRGVLFSYFSRLLIGFMTTVLTDEVEAWLAGKFRKSLNSFGFLSW